MELGSGALKRGSDVLEAGRRPELAILAIALLYLAYYLAKAPHGPVMTRDSPTYLDYDPIRTVGYPLVLRLLSPAGVVWLQPLAFTAVLGLMGVALWRLGGSLLLAGAVMLAACLYPDTTRFHGQVMTESLVMSLAMALVSAAGLYLLRPRLWLAATLSLVTGALVLVRPSCIVLIATTPSVAWLAYAVAPGRQPRWPATLTALLAPALLLFAADRVCDRVVHGPAATTLAGRHAFAKAALLDGPGAPAAGRPGDLRAGVMADHLGRDYDAMRAAVAGASDRETARLVRNAYENCLPWRCEAAARAAAGGDAAGVDRAAFSAALGRIERHPSTFARLVLSDEFTLWRPGAIDAPRTARRYDAYVSAHRPMPFEAEWPLLVQKTKPSRLAQLRSLAVSAAGVVTACQLLAVLAAAALRRPLSAIAAAAGFAALTAHAVIAFSALAAPPDHRFTTALWPILTFGVGLSVLEAIRLSRRRLATR